jgi:hypothetical protein
MVLGAWMMKYAAQFEEPNRLLIPLCRYCSRILFLALVSLALGVAPLLSGHSESS